MAKPSIERGIRYFKTKRYKQAIKEFLATDIDPSEDMELSYYMGLTYTHMEKYEDALNYLEQVVISNVNFLLVQQCRMILGYIYSITGRFKLAQFEFSKVLEQGLESVQVYSSLGYILYSQGKIEDSIKYLQKALELNENYSGALNSLGYIYADEGINLPESLELCKKACSLKPDYPPYLDSLGWAHFKSGKVQEAKSYLRRALDLLPGNKEIASHLKKVLSET
ncbi:MAG: tetratricopeptide repeat protein [Spirochaetales bacterium]|nr:tetratricopeptide repeat protein [Spirochaetales bacterium]